MSLDDSFQAAQARVQKLKSRPSNDDLLAIYALYKQATEGDVKGKRPGMLDVKGRAKYDAWARQKGTGADDAKARYVELVDRLERQLGTS
jgi:diazepam-binding inhibitor (GABA receptor modulator, acyl-CoA-binding protein)